MKLINNKDLLLILKDLKVIIKERLNLNVYLNIINIIFIFNNLINEYNIYKSFIKIINNFKK